MIQTKRYINVKKTSKTQQIKQNFWNFYDELFNAQKFDKIKKHCFKKYLNQIKAAEETINKTQK